MSVVTPFASFDMFWLEETIDLRFLQQ